MIKNLGECVFFAVRQARLTSFDIKEVAVRSCASL